MSVYAVYPGSDFRKAIDDFKAALSLREMWTNFAMEDLRKRFIRSYAGMWWVFLSFGAFVVVKAVIFTPLSPESLADFTPYVTLGFFIWVFMQTIISEGSNVFIVSANWLKGIRLPLSVFVLKSVTRAGILTLFNLCVVIIVFLITPVRVTPMWLLTFPIAALFLVNGLWATYLFGILGARFRDFVHLTTTVLRLSIFLTPIFWKPEQMGGLWEILKYNPFAHYVILFREPLLEGTIPWVSLCVVLAITVLGTLTSLVVFARARPNIPLWL